MEYKNLIGGAIYDKSRVYNCDCMDLLKQTPDNYYSLALVDPPYGINRGGGKMASDNLAKSKDYKVFAGGDLTPPNAEYFEELMRVSKNQIVWGANHFISNIPINSSCWIVWNKDNYGSNFADCELAWTSFKTSVRMFTWRWNGMLQQDMKNKEVRIHPTQKPVALYEWLLMNYAKEGDKILDTHLGSGSSRIAAHKLGFEFVGCELDKYYFEAQEKRFKTETMQQNLF